MVLLNAVQSVLSIIIMIALGYVLSFKGWFDDKSSALLSKLVVNIALPAYMISNLMSTYDKQKLLELRNGLVIPFASMGICYLISMFIAKVIKVDAARIGTFCSMFSLSNTIFVGLPVNLALFGENSVPYVLLYYIANTTLFWTIGVYGISKDGNSNQKNIFTFDTIKRIFSPPLTGFLVAVILILLGVKLPSSIMDTFKYLGNLTTPLSMLFIGIVIYSVNKKELRVTASMLVILAGRLLVAPLLVFGACHLWGLPILMKKVFIIQAAMPVMTQTPIIAKTYNADYKYAAVMTTATTIASLVSIPFYMLLLSMMG